MNRDQFPILKKAIYLDSGAGLLKPKSVVDKITEFYLEYPLNPHSSDSKIGVKLIKKLKAARKTVADLFDAKTDEIIFTSGATDSLNKISQMIKSQIKPGDEILLSLFNHASNMIPWIEIAKETGAKIVYSEDIIPQITQKTKLIAYAQQNNSLAKDINIDELWKKSQEVGAILVNDAAQAVSHEKVSLKKADIIVFSSNKLYGPTGSGALIIQKELLSKLSPTHFGGGANVTNEDNSFSVKTGTDGYEAGTLNTAGVLGMAAGIEYMNSLKGVREYEKELAEYTYDSLSKLDNVIIYSKRGDINTIFNVKGINSQDVVSDLGHKGVIIRGGGHCAKLVSQIIDIKTTVRASVSSYNEKSDIDKMVELIKNGGDFLGWLSNSEC